MKPIKQTALITVLICFYSVAFANRSVYNSTLRDSSFKPATTETFYIMEIEKKSFIDAIKSIKGKRFSRLVFVFEKGTYYTAHCYSVESRQLSKPGEFKEIALNKYSAQPTTPVNVPFILSNIELRKRSIKKKDLKDLENSNVTYIQFVPINWTDPNGNSTEYLALEILFDGKPPTKGEITIMSTSVSITNPCPPNQPLK